MKKTLTVILIMVLAVFSVSAVSVDLSVDGKLNGLQFSAVRQPDTPITGNHNYTMALDLGIDAKTAFFAKNGLGGYISTGYNLAMGGLNELDDPTHGMTVGAGFNYKINSNKDWSFVLGTGFDLYYGITAEHLNMRYTVDMDVLYNISRKAFIKLGLGYELEFLDAWQIGNEWKTRTYDNHKLLVPSIGAGIKF